MPRHEFGPYRAFFSTTRSGARPVKVRT
jgi:hypothetical protein